MTEWFPLSSSATLQFNIDIASVNNLDTYAVLAWVPESQSLTAFAGYSVAISGREIRVGKAIHKYFYRASSPATLTNQVLTLVLGLTPTNEQVVIEAKVLETATGAVLFDQSFIDSPAPDAMAEGTDTPAAPYGGRGRFVLMEYAEPQGGATEPREVRYANAIVSAPAPAHLLPVIDDVTVSNSASFVDLSQSILGLKASSDKPWDLLSGNVFVGALGPCVGGASFGYASSDDTILQGSDLLLLDTNKQYALTLWAIWAPGISNTAQLYFDTFSTNNPVIEAEDYNFNAGQFITEPVLTAEGSPAEWDAYRSQVGTEGVDFAYAGEAVRRYRPSDRVGTRRTLDYSRPKFVEAGGPENGFYDYEVFGLNAGDYLNYTHHFDGTFYEVYLRQSLVNVTQSTAALQLVSSDPAQPGQTTLELGYFLTSVSDFLFRNVPLTDVSGRTAVVDLGGVRTLRLSQISPIPTDAEVAWNYLVFVPFAPQVERATVVTGPYGSDPTAFVDPATATIQVRTNGQPCGFYRLRADVPTQITEIRLWAPDTIVMSYAPAVGR